MSMDHTIRASGRQEDDGQLSYLRASVASRIAKPGTLKAQRFSIVLAQGDMNVFLPRGEVSADGRHYYDGSNTMDDTIILDFNGSKGRLQLLLGGDVYVARVNCWINSTPKKSP